MNTGPRQPSGTSSSRNTAGQLPSIDGAAPRAASSLGPRVVSAAVAVPVLAVLIWTGFWAVSTLVVVVVILSLFEFYGVLERGGYHPRRITGIVCGLGFCVAAILSRTFNYNLTGAVLAFSILLSLTVELARRDRTGALVDWALTFVGACYVGWLLSHYIALEALDTQLVPNNWLASVYMSPGSAWLYAVLAITWLQDTGAYFAGRAFGRHRMAPYLSPKKTWEGAIGGLLSALIVGILVKPLLGLPISYAGAALLGIVGGIVGPLGDLAESLIKRQVNVKDAGALIPGHGGILDRVDSMLFTGPVLYYLILLLSQNM